MTNSLKPCPFCGSIDISTEAGLFIECDTCGAEGPSVHVGDAEIDPSRNAGEESVHAWNTRHVPEGMALVPVEDFLVLHEGEGMHGKNKYHDSHDNLYSYAVAMIKAAQRSNK